MVVTVSSPQSTLGEVDRDRSAAPEPVAVHPADLASVRPPAKMRDALEEFEGARKPTVQRLGPFALVLAQISRDPLEGPTADAELYARIAAEVAQPAGALACDRHEEDGVSVANGSHAGPPRLFGLSTNRGEDTEATRRQQHEQRCLQRAQALTAASRRRQLAAIVLRRKRRRV
jgi:hypothetical protein